MALRVYLVEDDDLTKKHLVHSLSREISIEWVGVADTEAEANDWLKRNPTGWDILIVDLFLREGTGAGVLRHCQQHAANQDVLVMTNHPISSLATHCRLLGANAVFDKSTEMGDLIAYCLGRATHTAAANTQHLPQ